MNSLLSSIKVGRSEPRVARSGVASRKAEGISKTVKGDWAWVFSVTDKKRVAKEATSAIRLRRCLDLKTTRVTSLSLLQTRLPSLKRVKTCGKGARVARSWVLRKSKWACGAIYSKFSGMWIDKTAGQIGESPLYPFCECDIKLWDEIRFMQGAGAGLLTSR